MPIPIPAFCKFHPFIRCLPVNTLPLSIGLLLITVGLVCDSRTTLDSAPSTRTTGRSTKSLPTLDAHEKILVKASNESFNLSYLKENPTKMTRKPSTTPPSTIGSDEMDTDIPNRAGRVNGIDVADARYQQYRDNLVASDKPFVIYRPKKLLTSDKSQTLTPDEPSQSSNYV